MNDKLNKLKAQANKLWTEQPFLCILLGIASANAGAKLMQANTDRKREKTWRREVTRREYNPKK